MVSNGGVLHKFPIALNVKRLNHLGMRVKAGQLNWPHTHTHTNTYTWGHKKAIGHANEYLELAAKNQR